MNNRKFKLLALLTVFSFGCGSADDFKFTGLPKDVSQVIKVESTGKITATVNAFGYRDGKWHKTIGPLPATVGKNGLATPDTKHEGDGCTPKGTYRIGPAFGYAPSIKTKLPYSSVTKDDLWIDDPVHPKYNRQVKSPTDAKSFEVLRRDDDCYELAAVIQYNTEPVAAGKGSAIFLHIWSGPNKPTAGCVALEKKHIEQLLEWLDEKQHPMIIIGE